jgi:HK97 family phage major capsid protein
MQTASLSLSDRRQRAEQNRDAARRFLQGHGSQARGPDVRIHGGTTMLLRLVDDPHEWRAQRRALSAQIQTAGGYLIPQTFADVFEEALLYASPLRDYGTIVTTERGGTWRLPTIDDTGNAGTIVGEDQTPSPTNIDVTTFGSITTYTQKFTSNWLFIPTELVEDAADIVLNRLAAVLGRRIARYQNTVWTPQILAAATLGVTTASATAIAGDELIALYFSIDPAYRERPGFSWQMNNGTLQYIRELKDAAGRYLFRQRRKPGEPDLLLGAPVAVNRDMAGIAASAITVACGDFSKIFIRDVGREARVLRTSETHADTDQDGYIAFMRSEAALADAGTHPVKYLQQHS